MQNPRLAAVYAKSLADLATEKNQLDQVQTDMLYLKAVCAASREFVLLLKSPVVEADKKQAIVSEVTKGNLNAITAAFDALLIKKGREGYLPEIINAFIDEYNRRKGITCVKITTAEPLSKENKNSILQKLKSQAGFNKVELNEAVNADLIGGFVLEYNNNLVDASVARDLRELKKQFQENVYA